MTREEAIAFGKRVIDLGFKGETQAFCELAIKALKQTPWIPVKTRTMTKEEVKEFNESEFDYPMDEDKENWTYDCRVPDEPCQVLITTAWDEVRCVEFGRDGSFVWFEGFEDRNDVKAWMPLPERYKAESEDNESDKSADTFEKLLNSGFYERFRKE